ncbi:flagellar motor protein MotB [Motilimonas sp. 1_MG-2023]|uniref:flagellar motor protein MotB n=1 Tax=Motilimonas sp. 1_MG-2023 TaxID=3062672 RepID=UPI0026E26C62|nr:flagellar motor protein MotB [Motilimonas sp. 1_MG-2023]MDO6524999.1 flagellar motor protein MotB [Motilimonas sp. 1_MG-2023]
MTRRVKKKHIPEHNHTERWLVSYADYMTLMFALFVVLYAAATVNEDKYKVVIENFYSATKEFSKHVEVSDTEGILTNEADEIIEEQGAGLLEDAGSIVDGGQDLSNLDRNKLGAPLTSLETELNESLLKELENGQASVTLDGDWLTIDISSGIIFPSGSAQISNSSAQLLTRIADILLPVSNFLRVRGYTDNQKINNEVFSSNWELSVARATSILRLLEQNGINPARLAVEGYGEYYPIVSNKDAAGRRKNRRVVIALSKYAYEPPSTALPSVNASGNLTTEATIEPILSETSADTSDYSKIIEVELPNGGLRITTRQE